METAFLFVSRIWEPRCLKKHRVGRREPSGLVMAEDPRVDDTGGAAATITGVAGGGLTGAAWVHDCVCQCCERWHCGWACRGEWWCRGQVPLQMLNNFYLVVHTVTVSFSLHNHVFLLHNCALIIMIVFFFFCIYAYTYRAHQTALSVVSISASPRMAERGTGKAGNGKRELEFARPKRGSSA